ncbi:MAG: hypothetical protein CMP91_04845 [Gammaproteobacteria bacterium]|nr:hypothetical protein [Gammaproteobacteria bacterium]|tara:strand:- start:459859 stop:460452 length:594 start_codon:yes stop_codon:yes gene_type:complete
MMEANIKTQQSNRAFKELRLLEERVRQSGASLPELNPRAFWNAVKCRIDGHNLVFPLLKVNEIIEYQKLTHLPGCADWIRGVINLRGRLLPAYDATAFFSPDKQKTLKRGTQIIVLEQGAMLCGLIPQELYGMQKVYHEEAEVISTEGQSDENSVLSYTNSALTLNNETWHQLDILQLARMLFHANPTLSQSGKSQG